MAKCGACGKFLAASAAAKCGRCSANYHHGCVSLPEAGSVSSKWLCPECKAHSPTHPVKIMTSFHTPEAHPSPVIVHNSTENEGEVIEADLALEIRSFRIELSELRAEVRQCSKEIADWKAALTLCNDNIKSCKEDIVSMDSRITTLEQRFEQRVPDNVDALEDTITELKCQLNDRDQELYLNDVEMAGVPELKDESLLHVVKVMVTKLGVSIDEKDIVHAERIGSTRRNRLEVANTATSADTSVNKPRRIAVRFARRATRDCVLRSARVRRSVTPTDARATDSPQRVYVNERLTSINRRLFYLARQAGYCNHWKYVWTRDGKIFARKEDGKQVERIRCDKDIIKVFGSSVV